MSNTREILSTIEPKKKKRKALSNLHFRRALEASNIDKDTIEKMVANAIANGSVASSSRVGKLQFAPQSLIDKIDELQAEFSKCKDEWNANLPSGQTVSKISINCNK